MTTNCEQYFEDPEAHVAHLESCADCRAVFDALAAEVTIAPRPIRIDTLPLAPWEGAAYRTWPLVLAGGASVLILAIVLFLAAGVSPLRGVARAVTSIIISVEGFARLFESIGEGLHAAPAIVHVVIGTLFIIINAILFLLLRRAPRGADV